MNRRRFLLGLGSVAPAALLLPELLKPKRTIFLPPWRRTDVRLVNSDGFWPAYWSLPAKGAQPFPYVEIDIDDDALRYPYGMHVSIIRWPAANPEVRAAADEFEAILMQSRERRA